MSFVAVTQQFNTSTSLGRLTLNILLSFAQFERELIGERTRDKMSAARKKGKWVGGCPVLGYDIVPGGGRLVINEAEAVRVRAIFAMFETYGSVLLTLQEIERRGWRLKSWTTKAGRCHAGGPFAMNSLRRILGNIIYTGSIQHHGKPYPGEHAAILVPGTWERVQALMVQGPAVTRGRARNKHLALLNGMLFCESCDTRMAYTYARKNGRKYPYYLWLNAQRKGWAVYPAKSLPAYAELARRDHVTRARMTQIMKLLHLAPDIQEQILCLPPITGLNERNLRSIVRCIDWDEQRSMFQKFAVAPERTGDSRLSS